MKATRTLEKTNDRTEKAFDCHRASCRRIFACDGAERCSDWWLSASNGRRGRQSCRTGTSLFSRRKIIRWFRNFVSSADQAPHKDLHVSKVAAVEWSAGRLTQFRSSERFRARRFPPPWSVEVSVDDLRYCSRCERSRLLFIILLSAFTVASAVSAATKHRRAAQTNSPAYNAAAYGAGSGISYSTACLPTDSPCRTRPDDW